MNYVTERREEKKERSREKIPDAAELVFSEKIFDDATTDQVARKARVSRALVYVYFKDKTALHLAICLRGLKILRKMFETTREQHSTGEQQIRAIGQAYMRFSEEFPTHFAAISRFEASSHEIVSDSPLLRDNGINSGWPEGPRRNCAGFGEGNGRQNLARRSRQFNANLHHAMGVHARHHTDGANQIQLHGHHGNYQGIIHESSGSAGHAIIDQPHLSLRGSKKILLCNSSQLDASRAAYKPTLAYSVEGGYQRRATTQAPTPALSMPR